MGIESLSGKKVGEFTLSVEAARRKQSEIYRFRIFLLGARGEKSVSPIAEGLYSSGVPSENIEGWIDCEYFEKAAFPGGSAADFSKGGLGKGLFRLFCSLIPEGGSLMVAYEMFYGKTKLHEETARLLNSGTPPEKTPIGKLILAAGCGSNQKDWYFPEGGSEGHMKLQGFKHSVPPGKEKY